MAALAPGPTRLHLRSACLPTHLGATDGSVVGRRCVHAHARACVAAIVRGIEADPGHAWVSRDVQCDSRVDASLEFCVPCCVNRHSETLRPHSLRATAPTRCGTHPMWHPPDVAPTRCGTPMWHPPGVAPRCGPPYVAESGQIPPHRASGAG